MKRTATFFVACMIAVGAMSGVAAADPYKHRPQMSVRVADLDLNSPADQAVMVERVERAARRMCRHEETRTESRKCAAETVEYTLSLVSPQMRHAFNAASDRRGSFVLTQK